MRLRSPRSFIRRLGPIAVVVSLAGCHRSGPASVESGEVRATDVDLGAASGAVLACALDDKATTNPLTQSVGPGGAARNGCKALAKGDLVVLPARFQSTRGGRARVDLGGRASLDLSGEASVVVAAGPPRRVSIERGAITVSEDHDANVEVAFLDRVARLGQAPTTIGVLASAADRATLTVRRGAVELAGPGLAPVALATGDTRRIRLGEAPDPKDVGDAAPAPVAPSFEREQRPPAPRGFGSLAARVPGTTETVGGVRLASHRVAVTVREGFARTEVEEEFANDSARVLEGTYRFPVPPGSSLTRLALWVGKELVEGEVVERARAARIFKDIVDDTVRPRDPALLEWSQGGAFSLKIFPIPAHGSRKVVLAYDQALPDRGGRTRYVYPMSLGADQAVAADAFSIVVTASDPAKPLTEIMTPGYPADVRTEDRKIIASWSADKLVPDGDFELSFQRGEGEATRVASYTPAAKEFGDDARPYAAIRVRVDPPEAGAAPIQRRLDRAIVVDASHSQSKASFADEARLAVALLKDLGAEERFVVLACDSACDSFPDDGFERGGDEGVKQAEAFLEKRAPGGSSDLAGAILEATRRLEGSAAAQAIVIGDGQPTSGELSAFAIAARVKGPLDRGHVDLRLLGIGRTVDELTLGGIARAAGAAYERVGDGQSLSARAADLALGLRRPLIVGAKLTMPEGFSDVTPSVLPSLKIGDELLVLARADSAAVKGELKLEGKVGGADYAIARPIVLPDATSFQTPLVPRLWAEGRIGELEASNEASDIDAVVALSKRFHVASRRTSLLVLENDRMFAAFGIARTTRSAGEQSDHVFGVLGGSPLASTPPDEHAPVAKNEPSAPVANWGEIGLTRNDPTSARGNMWGSEAGESFGKGGLGLSGVGEGGGGKGEGIGLGSVGSIGHGASAGSGAGFGDGHGRLGGSHITRAPQVRMGATMVSGRLPPEVIQRIVRQNFGRLRLCYENGLAKNPKLGGRVAVRFMIGRDGSVPVASDGGSDLGDAEVIKCVVNSFRALSFPEPPDSSGPITVTYPIQFSSDGTRPPNPQQPWPAAEPERPKDIWPLKPEEIPPKPTALHRAGDEVWRSSDVAILSRARVEAESDRGSRRKRATLIRALLAHGRFDEALIAAEAFAEADPDLATAGELLAEARAATGDGPGALAAVDAAAESEPISTAVHARAARAFEAAGDERRACAHWRSLAELKPSSDDDLTEALRCRARVLGDRDGALADAKAIEKPGARLAKLIETMVAGAAPAFADAAPHGQLVAKLACDGGTERCGTLVVVTPSGVVVSPWTPTSWRTGSSEVALGGLANGTYRTRLVGAPTNTKVTVTLRALGTERKFDVDTKPGDTTVAATVVTNMEWGS